MAVLEHEPAEVSFSHTINLRGSAISVTDSFLLLRNIRMKQNYGGYGACMELNQSGFKVFNSTFTSNSASKGGVILAAKSQGTFEDCKFEENIA